MNAQQLKGMIGMIRNMQNPQAMAEQMIRNNPTMTQALQYIQQNGGNPKQACEKLAAEKGFDLKDLGL